MAPRKSERLVNLTICLLASQRFLPKQRIREAVEGYRGMGDAAFERTFERDKDELRTMGVPIETGTNELLFDDEIGYRISRGDFELPPVEFSADEMAVLGAATRVWQQASVAGSTATALAKLRAAGVQPDTERLSALEPTLTAQEPAFDVLWQATLTRQRVEFDYRGGRRRRLEPWGVTWRSGRWYVLGRDLDADAPRMFKLARIAGVPRVVGEPGGYQVPGDMDLGELARRLEPREADQQALLAIEDDHAPLLRRRGEDADPPAGVTLPDGFAVYRVPFADLDDLVGEVAASAPHVLVLHPPQVRAALVEHLRAVVAAHTIAQVPASTGQGAGERA